MASCPPTHFPVSDMTIARRMTNLRSRQCDAQFGLDMSSLCCQTGMALFAYTARVSKTHCLCLNSLIDGAQSGRAELCIAVTNSSCSAHHVTVMWLHKFSKGAQANRRGCSQNRQRPPLNGMFKVQACTPDASQSDSAVRHRQQPAWHLISL
jgi:hypothetical protein